MLSNKLKSRCIILMHSYVDTYKYVLASFKKLLEKIYGMHRKFGAHECQVKIELYCTNQPPSTPTLLAQSSDTAPGSKPPTPISGDLWANHYIYGQITTVNEFYNCKLHLKQKHKKCKNTAVKT